MPIHWVTSGVWRSIGAYMTLLSPGCPSRESSGRVPVAGQGGREAGPIMGHYGSSTPEAGGSCAG
ncbi:hypothetical protein ACFFX0_31895 [Citricoccus parietis]|uniref:Uncharacterized protein n=1 Tax=Citricoccus parietis TaxID=592307 RepID=A0ABV5G9A4_9MICC